MQDFDSLVGFQIYTGVASGWVSLCVCFIFTVINLFLQKARIARAGEKEDSFPRSTVAAEARAPGGRAIPATPLRPAPPRQVWSQEPRAARALRERQHAPKPHRSGRKAAAAGILQRRADASFPRPAGARFNSSPLFSLGTPSIIIII